MPSEQALAMVDSDLEAARPPPEYTVSAWSDRYRILPDDEAEPGPWRTDRTPYLREPMDCLTPSNPCRVVALMKGSQTGGTEGLILNAAGYWIHHAPGRMLLIRPDEDEARDFSVQRVKPMIRLTPELSKRCDAGEASNVMLMDFPGGSLKLAGARAPAGLRSKPVPYVLGDEIDNWPADSGGEGDPLTLATKRQTNFPNRKTSLVSTPVDDEDSRILEWWLRGDRCTFWLPCPQCDELFVLEWQGICIPEDEDGTKRPEQTHYVCPNNGCVVDNGDKAEMLPRGIWRPLADLTPLERMAALRVVGLASENGEVDERVDDVTSEPHVRSFHLSSLYSPVGWLDWAQISRDFLLVRKDPVKLKTFVNTALGQTWKQSDGETVGSTPLYERRADWGRLPHDRVAFLTAGVDVQADRLECEVVGWGRGFESWSVDYLVIPGDPTGRTVWEDLDAVLARKYPTSTGGTLRVEAACIDSGYEAKRVYEYVKKRWKRRVWAVKGRAETKDEHEIWPLTWNKSQDKAARFKLIGTKRAKRHVYTRLAATEPGPGYCHVPSERPLWWFQQLTAEKWQRKYHRGKAYREWHLPKDGPSKGRNEALDCRVYAYAAAHGLERSGRRIDEVLDRRTPEADEAVELDAGAVRPETKRRKRRVNKRRDSFVPRREW